MLSSLICGSTFDTLVLLDTNKVCVVQAGRLSEDLRDKRAQRAVARATANAYREVTLFDIFPQYMTAFFDQSLLAKHQTEKPRFDLIAWVLHV